MVCVVSSSYYLSLDSEREREIILTRLILLFVLHYNAYVVGGGMSLRLRTVFAFALLCVCFALRVIHHVAFRHIKIITVQCTVRAKISFFRCAQESIRMDEDGKGNF